MADWWGLQKDQKKVDADETEHGMLCTPIMLHLRSFVSQA
jgi:hypothetical protein